MHFTKQDNELSFEIKNKFDIELRNFELWMTSFFKLSQGVGGGGWIIARDYWRHEEWTMLQIVEPSRILMEKLELKLQKIKIIFKIMLNLKKFPFILYCMCW